MELACTIPGVVSLRQIILIEEVLHWNWTQVEKAVSRLFSTHVDLSNATAERLSQGDSKRYRSNVGSRLYLATKARRELCQSASVLASHVLSPRRTRAVRVKRVVLYLRSRKHICILLTIGYLVHKNAYVNSSWGAQRGSKYRSRTLSSYDLPERQFTYTVYC